MIQSNVPESYELVFGCSEPATIDATQGDMQEPDEVSPMRSFLRAHNLFDRMPQ